MKLIIFDGAGLKENEVRIRGGIEGDERAIYAFQTMQDSTKQVVGKLNIISLRKQTPTVHLISVNGAELPSVEKLKKDLNRIYKTAAVTWNVIKEDGLQLDFENNVFDHGGSGIFDIYPVKCFAISIPKINKMELKLFDRAGNEDQNDVIDLYEEERGEVKEDDYLPHQIQRNFNITIMKNKELKLFDGVNLFFIKNAINKGTEIGGYMPMGCQYGFLHPVKYSEISLSLYKNIF
jgi:hypothetical protein